MNLNYKNVLLYFCVTVFITFLSVYIIQIYSEKNRRAVDVNLRKKVLTEMLDIIITVSHDSNTKPFLLHGSLLGSYRNSKIICHDYDLDFGILEYDFNNFYDRIKDIITKYPEYELVLYKLPYYKMLKLVHKKTRLNADIDIFLISDNGNTIRQYAPGFYTTKYYKNCMVNYPIDWFFPLKQGFLENRTVFVPSKPEKLLECFYGQNFETPDHKCNSDCSICKKVSV